MSTKSRKADHIRINVDRDVDAKGVTSGFERWTFQHSALPEIDLAEVDTSITLFGKALRAPLIVSCMTGGTPEAKRINDTLASVAQHFGIAMGLGSGRALIENPDSLETFAVRDRAPDVLLLANLGAVQLNKGYGADECRKLLDLLHADALVLHLNPLQEALQPEGDTNFRGLLKKIKRLCKALDVPVVVKEVGWGIAPDLVKALVDAGVDAIDVAGAGGTSWSEVERHRLSETWRQAAAREFAGWGIPTAACIVSARRAAPRATLIASGGVRTGLDVAKAIALGADAAGIAGPFLRAADKGEEEARNYALEIIEALRVAMFCIGAVAIDDLRNTPRLLPA